jgi:hypothetical protein
MIQIKFPSNKNSEWTASAYTYYTIIIFFNPACDANSKSLFSSQTSLGVLPKHGLLNEIKLYLVSHLK